MNKLIAKDLEELHLSTWSRIYPDTENQSSPTAQANTNPRRTRRPPIYIPQYAREMMVKAEETHVVAEEEEVHKVPAPRRTRCVVIPAPRYAADAHEPLIETLVEIEEIPDPKDYQEDTDNKVDTITHA